MVEDGHQFFAKKNRILDDEQHLAEMVSLVGPPPPEFLRRSEKCLRYWDEQGMQSPPLLTYLVAPITLHYFPLAGNWKGSIPIPEQSLETRAQQFSDEDRELFLSFLRRTFHWVSEERHTAEELAYDDFLMQPVLAAGGSL